MPLIFENSPMVNTSRSSPGDKLSNRPIVTKEHNRPQQGESQEKKGAGKKLVALTGGKRIRRNHQVDAETAKLLLGAITGLAVIVWLAGLKFLISASRFGRKKENPDQIGPDSFEESPAHCLTGSVELEGQADALTAKARRSSCKKRLSGRSILLRKPKGRFGFSGSDREPFPHRLRAGSAGVA